MDIFWTATIGIILIIAGIIGLAMNNGKPNEKTIIKYDEESLDAQITALIVWDEDDDFPL
jgi:hypothetical protein